MTTTTNNEQKKLNVPNLRFKEFQGEWEKFKLSDLCTFFSGGTPSSSNKDFYGGDIAFIRSGELHADSTELFISQDGYDNSSAKMVEIGDLLLAMYGATSGDIAISKIKGAINQAILCIRTNQNKKFIESVWNKHVSKILRKYLQGGQGNLSADIVKGISFSFPTLEEQERIANLISLLDERIATQNKIIEDLKKLKSAIIEKVFNGKHSEKLQLNDVGSYIRGLTYSSNDVVEHGGTIVMRSNNIINGSLLDYNNNVVFVNKQMSAEQQLQNGDVVICMANGSSSLVGKSSFYDGSCHSPITVGAFCGIYRSKEPIVKWLFQTNKYRRYIWNSLQGGNGAIANLNGEDILNMSFPIPNATFKDTCVKMLTSVDSALENNMSLCALYTLQKQHMLRQMFI
uniref:restriction endonuclease subunit S n=1 Tax=Alloprevotella sp. TaxID=1872471 RepID=UPI003FF07D05